MGHPSPLYVHLAHRYAAWFDQATRCHALLRALRLEAEAIANDDGTITLRVPIGTWRGVVVEADSPVPEQPDTSNDPDAP